MAVTSAQIWAELGNPTEPTGPDLTHLTLVTGAVNAYVAALPIVENVDEWPDDVTAGAVLLGARLYVRRNSPNGIVTFQEMGATYVSRYDSDIARLLRIDKFAPGVAI